MDINTVSHEAGDKWSGIRLQKLRVVSEVLEIIEKDSNVHIFAAIEYMGDVFINNFKMPIPMIAVEEDKNYKTDSSFSLNSKQIITTLVNFLDIWLKNDKGTRNIIFRFYSTNSIGKEIMIDKLEELKISLPTEPMLVIMSDSNKIAKDELALPIIEIIKHSYKKFYEGRKSQGYAGFIDSLDIDDWKKFLSLIKWDFNQPDENDLIKTVNEKIKASKYFSRLKLNDENIILSQILELFDSRMSMQDYTQRVVHGAEIELTFFKAANPELLRQRLDPVWTIWESLPSPDDKRSIKEKVEGICKNYNSRKFGILALKVARGKKEWNELKADKSFVSLKYRVYEYCLNELESLIQDMEENVTEDEVNELLQKLIDKATECVKELSNSFDYKFSNQITTEGIVLDLIDSCYISFKYE